MFNETMVELEKMLPVDTNIKVAEILPIYKVPTFIWKNMKSFFSEHLKD